VLQRFFSFLQHLGTGEEGAQQIIVVLHYVAVCCSKLQCVATCFFDFLQDLGTGEERAEQILARDPR